MFLFFSESYKSMI